MIAVAKGMVSIYIKCPYYKREERKGQTKIVCEGILEGTSLHQTFGNLADLKKHKNAFCMGRYNRCPVAEALNRKYDYEA